MGKVLQSTRLVGGSTVKSLCNATFAIQLFNAGSFTQWLTISFYLVGGVGFVFGFFFSV